ncbi:MAG: Ig-like domain-containing protein [Myxococcota bacterium]
MRAWTAAALGLAALTFAGCGSGDGGPEGEAPAITLTSPPANSVVQSPQITVGGTVTDADGEVARLAWTLDGGPEREVTDVLDPTGTFSFAVTLGQGANTITVVADDDDGLRGTASVSVTLTSRQQEDTTRPDLVILEPADGATVEEAALTVVGSATDDVGVDRLTHALNGGGEIDVTDTLESDGGFAFDVTLSPGSNSLLLFAYDRAGNRDVETLDVTFADPGRLPDATVTLASGATHQTFRAWRADARVVTGEGCPPAEEWRPDLLDAARDLGLDALRLPVPAAVEPANDDEDPATAVAEGFDFTAVDRAVEDLVLPLRDRLEADGGALRLVVAYEDPGDATFVHREAPAEYAELVAVTLGHLDEAWGVAPDAVEIAVGPGAADWTDAQVGEAAVALGVRLDGEGWSPEIVAPVGAPADAAARLEGILAVEGAADVITGLSYVRGGDATIETLEGVGAAAAEEDLDVIAAAPARPVRDLDAARAGTWHRGALGACPPDAADDAWLAVEPGGQVTAEPAAGVRLLAPWLATVRPGDTLLGSDSDDPLFHPAAFLRPDAPPAVVVESGGAGSLRVVGLPAETWQAAWTTADDAGTLPPETLDQGDALVVSIPGAGVISVSRAP